MDLALVAVSRVKEMTFRCFPVCEMSRGGVLVGNIFLSLFIFKMGFPHVGQAGLELSTSGDPPALASKVLGLQA